MLIEPQSASVIFLPLVGIRHDARNVLAMSSLPESFSAAMGFIVTPAAKLRVY